jgi:hypothetical protein
MSRIESTTVIVDDCWALVGSSTFSRRGLCFDGGSDIVFTDQQINRGAGKPTEWNASAGRSARRGFPLNAR